MAAITSFGRYLPERRLGNRELAAVLSCEPEWILRMTGIEERRVASPDETVVAMGVAAARNCLENSRSAPGLILMASGSSEARFPGPAAEVGHRLGFSGVPSIDLPLASAGSLFAIALASRLAPAYGDILVVAAEKMSVPALAEPVDRNIAALFGDGAGACLVSLHRRPHRPPALEIVDSVLHSDGAWADDLRLERTGPIRMNGAQVIMQAARKIPAAIREVLDRNGVSAQSVSAFLLHQANQNLTDRVAKALGVPAALCCSNIRIYGNTSSASMLIAAAEWYESAPPSAGDRICFAAFGAGFHWGALLAEAGVESPPGAILRTNSE